MLDNHLTNLVVYLETLIISVICRNIYDDAYIHHIIVRYSYCKRFYNTNTARCHIYMAHLRLNM